MDRAAKRSVVSVTIISGTLPAPRVARRFVFPVGREITVPSVSVLSECRHRNSFVYHFISPWPPVMYYNRRRNGGERKKSVFEHEKLRRQSPEFEYQSRRESAPSAECDFLSGVRGEVEGFRGVLKIGEDG